MNRTTQAHSDMLGADHGARAAIATRPAPLQRNGWPPLSVTIGVHRRESDVVPWYREGPADPWDRSWTYPWPWR